VVVMTVGYADLERRWREVRIEQATMEDAKRAALLPLRARESALGQSYVNLHNIAPVDGFCPDCGVQRFTGRPHACGEG
jgi:hypothetical protein